MAIAITITGIEALAAKFRALGASLPAAAGKALVQEGERIMTDAKRRTPVDTGALRASGQTAWPDVAAASVSVTLGFGNTAVKYAVYVHENLAARHPVGEAKFLENAVMAAERGIGDRLASTLRRDIEALARVR